MSFSHNEVAALATKAARGAGSGPAQAQAFGRAVVCHLGAGRDPQSLIEALDALPEGPIQTGPLVCRVVTQHSDNAAKVGLTLDLPQDLARSYLDTLRQPRKCTFALLADAIDAYTIPPDAPQPLPERIEMPTPLLTRLNRLAKETYVPNTAASRSAGAGAGLHDND